ncbi:MULTISPECIES: hypothetical protein [unclassified Campylobacter]|nr:MULTISPECIES: hypothetical protein [unclassified Campylobacter]
MLYDTEVLNENDYKKECARLLIAFENLNYKQENAIHIARNITIGYGLDLLKCDGQPKDFLLDYLPNDSKKLKIGDEELTFYEIIEKYRANKAGFTDPKIVKGYLQNRVFSFSLTQEQAQKVLENMIPIYEKRLSNITTNYLPYSKERASLLSMRYLGKGIENNGLIKAIKNNSRFLSWFIIRYKTNVNTYVGYIARSADEADIYLSNPNINKISLIFDIFSYLNIKKEQIKYRTYQDNESIENFTTHVKEDTLLNLAKWYENDLDFIRFNSQNKVSKISKSNISQIVSNFNKKPINDIVATLKPHLDYLNTLTQKNFSLDNIYCIANYCENLGANKLDNVALLNKTLRQKFEKLEANTPHNILILYPNPTPSIIQIEQPKNTFITLLIGAKAKIDCTKLIEDQCELMYLKYDPTQEEQQAINPQAFSCSTQEELILKKENEIYFKAVKNNISYFINKNDGILKVALTGNEENAIELYSFAKENQFKILQDKASKMLKIYLKLERYSSEEILSHRGGNFELTLNNLKILDENGNNHETITKVFLHNCENRRIYESLKLEYQEGIYKSSFKIDLILDENSSFFKRATKCIIATKALEGFSTSQMHKIGNVAIVSLSSADKKGGCYTFTNKVSMQDFGENLYLDTEANGYEKQIKNSRKDLYITGMQAYKDKEQQNTTDKIPYNETIFVRAYLNNEEKFFFDETIKWAYCVKKEEELECNQSKIKILENLQGNDIAFNTSMLSQDDRNKLYNMNEKYQLILFAYFNTPAFKTTQGITHLVLK